MGGGDSGKLYIVTGIDDDRQDSAGAGRQACVQMMSVNTSCGPDACGEQCWPREKRQRNDRRYA